MTRNVFVNQTLTARTVGLVGGVLAGLALALTGSLIKICFCIFVNYLFSFQNRPKCIATDNYLHPQEDGLVSFPFPQCIAYIRLTSYLTIDGGGG